MATECQAGERILLLRKDKPDMDALCVYPTIKQIEDKNVTEVTVGSVELVLRL